MSDTGVMDGTLRCGTNQRATTAARRGSGRGASRANRLAGPDRATSKHARGGWASRWRPAGPGTNGAGLPVEALACSLRRACELSFEATPEIHERCARLVVGAGAAGLLDGVWVSAPASAEREADGGSLAGGAATRARSACAAALLAFLDLARWGDVAAEPPEPAGRAPREALVACAELALASLARGLASASPEVDAANTAHSARLEALVDSARNDLVMERTGWPALRAGFSEPGRGSPAARTAA